MPTSMKRLLPVPTVFGVFLLSVGAGWCDDLQKGLDAYKSGDYATALREWRPFAEQYTPWASAAQLRSSNLASTRLHLCNVDRGAGGPGVSYR